MNGWRGVDIALIKQPWDRQQRADTRTGARSLVINTKRCVIKPLNQFVGQAECLDESCGATGQEKLIGNRLMSLPTVQESSEDEALNSFGKYLSSFDLKRQPTRTKSMR